MDISRQAAHDEVLASSRIQLPDEGVWLGEIFMPKSIVFFIWPGLLRSLKEKLRVELFGIVRCFFIVDDGTRNAIIKISLLFSPGKSQSALV